MSLKKIANITLAILTLSFSAPNSVVVAASQPNAFNQTFETLKHNRVLASLNAGEQVIGDINAGDADHHCKFWFLSSAYVVEFNQDTSVAVCSRNGSNGRFTGGYEGNPAETTNVSFDTLCYGKYEWVHPNP
jgi:hypothetical protein